MLYFHPCVSPNPVKYSMVLKAPSTASRSTILDKQAVVPLQLPRKYKYPLNCVIPSFDVNVPFCVRRKRKEDKKKTRKKKKKKH